MSTSANLPRRQPDRPGFGFMLAIAASALWICGTAAASATGDGAPPGPLAISVAPAAAAPVLPGDALGEMERQQRLHELRRQLLEHSRSWRGDAALRRSAAMPEPNDTPAVVADKILPLAPLPAAEGTLSPVVAPAQALPLTPGVAARLPQALPDAVPEVLASPVAPVVALPAVLPQAPEAVQTAAGPLKTGTVADTTANPDARLTERERRQLRQQLRQVLRLQEPAGNR